MADEDNNAVERLNNNEFCELIPHLTLQELLAIEYRINKWSLMIQVKDSTKKLYNCEVCGVSQYGAKNLYIHIEGKKHKWKMQTIKQLYHPQYTYAKSQWKLARGVINANDDNDAEIKTKTGITSNVSINEEIVKENKTAEHSKTESIHDEHYEDQPNDVNSLKTNIIRQSTSTTNAIVAKPAVPKKNIGKAKINVMGQSKTLKTMPKCANKNSAGQIKVSNSMKSNIIEPTNFTTNKAGKVKPTTVTNLKTNSDYLANPTSAVKTKIRIMSASEINRPIEPKLVNVSNKKKSFLNTKSSEIDTKNNGKESPPRKKSKTDIGISSANIAKSACEANREETNNQQSKITNKNVSNAAEENQIIFSIDIDSDDDSEEVDGRKKGEQKEFVKNPFALKSIEIKEKSEEIQQISSSQQETHANISVCSDVIVIDDDKLTDSEKDESIEETNTVKKIKIPASSEFIRGIECKKTEAQLSKRQSFLPNPAAAYLETEGRKDKPNYQSDIIIIPTIHKNKTKVHIPCVKEQPQFSTKIFSSKPSDDDVHGLIGVEYVVKILKSRDDRSPKYECGLCELVLDGYAMQNHLVGYNHRLKFCEKHFPTAIRQYRQYMGNIPQHEVYKVMPPILAKLAVAIEQHHGRYLPYECFERQFNINRHGILSKVFSCRHASEQYGPTFTHVVDSKEIDEFIAQRHTYKPHKAPREPFFDTRPTVSTSHRVPNAPFPNERRHNPVSEPTCVGAPYKMHQPFTLKPQFKPAYNMTSDVAFAPIDDETHKLMVEDFLKGNKISSQRSRPTAEYSDREHCVRKTRSRSRSDNRIHRSRSHSNSRLERDMRKSISPLRNNDIWQAYRHLVDQKFRELNEFFKAYRKDPESHPVYNEEWQKFWKRRKDELSEAGLDHQAYNYQPEWVRFFNVRIEELYAQSVENIKIESRNRLCLPMTNDQLTDSKYHVQVDRYIDVERNTILGKTKEQNKNLALYVPKVISVLRLMTALEENLGSLGPRVVDLLSKALQIEKSNPDQVSNIILTPENCTLLETAKEKFKGLVIAGLLEGSKERALKKVIQDVEALLNFAEKDQSKNVPSEVTLPEPCTKSRDSISYNSANKQTPAFSKPVEKRVIHAPDTQTHTLSGNKQFGNHLGESQTQNSTISTLLEQYDKKELATKLAAALTAQGKTDYDPDQLHQLITVYSLIQKKKREASIASNSEMAVSATNVSIQKPLSDTLSGFLKLSTPSDFSSNKIESAGSNETYTSQSINNYINMMRRSAEVLSGGFQANCQTVHNLRQNQHVANTRVEEGNSCGYNKSNNTSKSSAFVNHNISFSNFGPNSSLSTKRFDSAVFPQNSAASRLNISTRETPIGYRSDFSSNFKPNANSMKTVNTSGNYFTKTNNNSRMDSNNINIGLANQHGNKIIAQQQRYQHMERSTHNQNPDHNQSWLSNVDGRTTNFTDQRNNQYGNGANNFQIHGGQDSNWCRK